MRATLPRELVWDGGVNFCVRRGGTISCYWVEKMIKFCEEKGKEKIAGISLTKTNCMLQRRRREGKVSSKVL